VCASITKIAYTELQAAMWMNLYTCTCVMFAL